MKAALQMLLDALAAPDKRVIQRSVYPEEVFNPERLQELIQKKMAERLPTGEIETRAASRYEPIQRAQAKALLDAAGSWGTPPNLPPENLKFVARDPSATKALLKLLVEGKQGEKARATLVALAAKRGMLPNHLFHGTNEHAVTGIAQTKKTAPQVSWTGGQGMAVPSPRTYWTPQPSVARGMAAETSKVGNLREELRHKALDAGVPENHLQLLTTKEAVSDLAHGIYHNPSLFTVAEHLGEGKYGASPLQEKAAQTYANAMKREAAKIVEFAAARGEKIAATHPYVLHAAAKRVSHTMSAVLNKTPTSEAEKRKFLGYAADMATNQYETLSNYGPPLSAGPSAWDSLLAPLNTPLPPRPKVGDAGRPAVISTKLSKIAPKLDADSLKELIRKLAGGSKAADIARETYELTSKAVPASKLAARVVNPPNPELGESLRGLLFRSAKKMAPLEAVAEMLLKRRL